MSPTAGGSPGRGVRPRLLAALRRRVEIDLRALATVRIALATLLLVNLATRARHFTALHTDRGMLPAAAVVETAAPVRALLTAVGEPWLQILLFPVAAVVAIALLAGYRTRTATVLSTVLLVLLHARNPLVLNSGDALLLFLLFWGIFLPLGERWSFDARRIDRDRTTVASVGTAAALVQVLLVYLVNASHKIDSELWMAGEAVPTIFQADQFTIMLGEVLADVPIVLTGFSYLWMALLFASPLLLLATGYVRAVLVTLLAGMHAGMALAMPIGLFPAVSITGLLLFYPPVVWDAAEGLVTRWESAARVRGWITRFTAPIPTPGGFLAMPDGARIDRIRSVARTALFTVLPAVVLALVVLSAMGTTGVADPPDAAETAVSTIGMEQEWRMFAPHPTRTTRWYAAPANRTDGERVDALHGGPVSLSRPEEAADSYPSFRWRKGIRSIHGAEHDAYRAHFADFLCDRYNRTHDADLESVSLYYGYERTDYRTGSVEDSGGYTVIEYDCGGPILQDESG